MTTNQKKKKGMKINTFHSSSVNQSKNAINKNWFVFLSSSFHVRLFLDAVAVIKHEATVFRRWDSLQFSSSTSFFSEEEKAILKKQAKQTESAVICS